MGTTIKFDNGETIRINLSQKNTRKAIKNCTSNFILNFANIDSTKPLNAKQHSGLLQALKALAALAGNTKVIDDADFDQLTAMSQNAPESDCNVDGKKPHWHNHSGIKDDGDISENICYHIDSKNKEESFEIIG